jgi:hypothetical protein
MDAVRLPRDYGNFVDFLAHSSSLLTFPSGLVLLLWVEAVGQLDELCSGHGTAKREGEYAFGIFLCQEIGVEAAAGGLECRD